MANLAAAGNFSQKAQVSIDRAFSKASRVNLKWNEVLQSEELANFLQNEAEKYRSRRNLIGTSLLSSVSGLIGPTTCLEPVLTKEAVKPSIFIIAVAAAGAGKSSAINRFTVEPIQKIAKEYKQRIISADFTKAGLCKVLSETKGYLLLAADECATTLKAQLSATSGEGSMRNLMNMLWDCRGYDKDFATKDRIYFEQSYFTLFGTSHADTMVSLLQTIDSVADGLRDRFFTTVSHMIRDEPHGQQVFEAPEDWQYTMLRDIYRAHHHKVAGTNEFTPIKYRLSDEAKGHVKSISVEEDDELDQQWADFDRLVDKDDIITIADRPCSSSSSKELQMALRMAVVLHVLRSYLDQLRMGTYAAPQPATIRHTPTTIISQRTVEEAIKLVGRMNEMQDYFLTVARQIGSTGTLSSPIKEAPATNIALEILIYQGKFVTSSMILRKMRKTSAGAVIAAMVELSKKAGTDGCVGTYVSVNRTRGRKIHVFYKAPPATVCNAKLKEIGIDPIQYNAAFENDLQDVPNGVNIGEDNWEKYTQMINSKRPRLL